MTNPPTTTTTHLRPPTKQPINSPLHSTRWPCQPDRGWWRCARGRRCPAAPASRPPPGTSACEESKCEFVLAGKKSFFLILFQVRLAFPRLRQDSSCFWHWGLFMPGLSSQLSLACYFWQVFPTCHTFNPVGPHNRFSDLNVDGVNFFSTGFLFPELLILFPRDPGSFNFDFNRGMQRRCWGAQQQEAQRQEAQRHGDQFLGSCKSFYLLGPQRKHNGKETKF